MDGRLGLVSALDAPCCTVPVTSPTAPAREDFLMGSYRAGSHMFAAGDTVAARAALILPVASPDETAKLAALATAENTVNGMTLRFTVPDGHPHMVPLSASGAAAFDSAPIK